MAIKAERVRRWVGASVCVCVCVCAFRGGHPPLGDGAGWVVHPLGWG